MAASRRSIMSVILWPVGLAVAFATVAWLGQRRLLYFPDREVGSPPAHVETAVFTTSDGVDHQAWIVPSASSPLGVVVVCNGNAGDRADRLPLAEGLAAEGLDVVLFDYRGYGDTEGSPTQERLVADTLAAVEFASSRGSGLLVLFGESLGAAAAAAAAIERNPDALVLRSPFTSLVDVARAHYGPVPGWFLRDRWPTREWVAAGDVPTLVIAGTDDEIVPVDQSRAVADAAGARFVGIPARHNDPELTSGPAVIAAVREFLRSLEG